MNSTIKTFFLIIIIPIVWLMLTIMDSILWLIDGEKYGFIEGQKLTIESIKKSFKNIWAKE